MGLRLGRRGCRRRELTRSVDHPVALPQAWNWRATAVATAVVAALELVVLLVLAFVAFGLPFAAEQKERALASIGQETQAGESAASAQAGAGKAGVPAAEQRRGETLVVVLNGNGITGAADIASYDVRERSYVLTGTGNAPRSDFRRTIVMYRPGFEGEAHRLAKDVGAKRVAPLDGLRASDLMGAQLALIVGRT